MSRWGENTVNIGWARAAGRARLQYWQCGCAARALNEFSRCGSDSLHQMPQVTKAIDVHAQNLRAGRRRAGDPRAWRQTGVGSYFRGVCDSSGTYLEGSQLAFCELTSSNYEELRWRHGFDGETSGSFGSSRRGTAGARPGTPARRTGP